MKGGWGSVMMRRLAWRREREERGLPPGGRMGVVPPSMEPSGSLDVRVSYLVRMGAMMRRMEAGVMRWEGSHIRQRS